MRALLVIFILFVGHTAWANTSEANASRSMTVTGEASIAVAPDMAQLTVGATSQDKDPVAAMNATSETLNKLISRLEEEGVVAKDIQTSSLRLTRQSQWNQQVEVFVGFQASNVLNIRVRDLSRLSDVLGALVGEGANSLTNLTWDVQEKRALNDQARRAAIKDAMAKAALYAETAGVTLGPILSISDKVVQQTPGPFHRETVFHTDVADSVPLAAGEVTTSASVTMVFEIAKGGE